MIHQEGHTSSEQGEQQTPPLEPLPKHRSVLKRWVNGGLVILICLVVSVGGVYASFPTVYDHYFKQSGPLGADAEVVIEPGMSLSHIAQSLHRHGVIDHPQIFSLWLRVTRQSKALKAGQYLFSAGISSHDVIGKLTLGDTMIHHITIAEGLMSFQILEQINDAPYLIGELPSGIEEGELLPETYQYRYKDTKESVVMRMQQAMHDAITRLWETRQADLPFKNKHEALIFASIVEKETGIASERNHVSGVFVNRLRQGMRLQTDPTVIYAITKGNYVLERSLRFKDLEMVSPYNTYKHYGLPPGPIANPGRDAIAAALNPVQTSDLYFVADGSGGHAFAATLQEHNRNVNKWRKISRKLRAQQRKNAKNNKKVVSQ